MKKLIVMAALLLSGCAAEQPPAPQPVPQPSPSMTPGEKIVRMRPAAFTEPEMVPFGFGTWSEASTRSEHSQYQFALAEACDVETSADDDIAHMLVSDGRLGAAFMGNDGQAQQRLAYYEGSTGAEAVAEFREELRCETYYSETFSRQRVNRIMGKLELPSRDNVEAQWAFCEEDNDAEPTQWSKSNYSCTVLMGRANFAAVLEVTAKEPEKVQQLAAELAPKLAEALGRIK